VRVKSHIQNFAGCGNYGSINMLCVTKISQTYYRRTKINHELNKMMADMAKDRIPDQF